MARFRRCLLRVRTMRSVHSGHCAGSDLWDEWNRAAQKIEKCAPKIRFFIFFILTWIPSQKRNVARITAS